MSGLNSAQIKLFSRDVGNFEIEQAREAARRMFDRNDHPDAVFVANDHMAIGVMDVLRIELGLSVPNDVSIIGYDDVSAASWSGYSLTTVRQPAKQLVEETVSILIDQIEHKASNPRRIAIDGPLIVRGSSRIPEGWKNERF